MRISLLVLRLFIAPAYAANDVSEFDGEWYCARTLNFEGLESETKGGFDLFANGSNWTTRTYSDAGGYSDYKAKVQRSDGRLTANFHSLENTGEIDQYVSKNQQDNPFPQTVVYIVQDVDPQGFILETQYSILNCQPRAKSSL